MGPEDTPSKSLVYKNNVLTIGDVWEITDSSFICKKPYNNDDSTHYYAAIRPAAFSLGNVNSDDTFSTWFYVSSVSAKILSPYFAIWSPYDN